MFQPNDKYFDLVSNVENFKPVSQSATSSNSLHEPSSSAFETKPISAVSDSEWTLFQCRLEYALVQNKS